MDQYLTHILYLVAIIGVLSVNWMFIRDKELRAWIMTSMEDSEGRASGKALSAFVCTFAIVVGWFIAMHYGESHLAPEYYFVGLLSYAGGLYGIKEIGKVMNTKYTAPFSGGNGNGNNNNGNNNSSGNNNGNGESDNTPETTTPPVQQENTSQNNPNPDLTKLDTATLIKLLTQNASAIDVATLIALLKTKHKESGSQLSFEDWVKEQNTEEPSI